MFQMKRPQQRGHRLTTRSETLSMLITQQRAGTPLNCCWPVSERLKSPGGDLLYYNYYYCCCTELSVSLNRNNTYDFKFKHTFVMWERGLSAV